MDAARFATGLTYDAYKARMTRNREALEENESRVKLEPQDVAHFRSLRPLHVVALVEDWCADVVANLPVLGVLAREIGESFELRCFLKDENEDLMERYLNRGRFESIPVFAFFDDTWREVGVFIERPTSVTERREQDRRRIHAEHPDFGSPDTPIGELPDEARSTVSSLMQQARREWKPWADRQLVLAIRDCTARAPQVGERVGHSAGSVAAPPVTARR